MLNNTLVSNGVVASIQDFANSSNPEMFRQANNQIASSLGYIYQLSSLKISRSTGKADSEASTKTFEQFVNQTESTYQAYRKKITEAEETVEVASKEIEAAQTSIKQLEDAFNSKMVEWANQSTETHNEQTTRFTDAQNTRQSDYTAALDLIKSEANEQLNIFYQDVTVSADKDHVSLKSKLDEIQQDAEKKHGRILELYGLVAYDSVTGGYKSVADIEERAANRWRQFTIACIGATVLWLLIAIWLFKPDLEPERLFWSEIFKGLSLTALLISTAVYASKQSTLHRLNERRARSFFLQVQAFDPFISDLPEDKKVALKEILSGKIFGGVDFSDENKSIATSEYEGMNNAIDLLSKLQQLTQK
ncbi:hypothetical protein HB779_16120 [Phyllobacterium sp. 628]|uniref:hypothetical protein n=1 Tax=Phyllobacterium sp. 628 TaxID=2718938 RepID=UPI0016627B53|nr:hypothetical protein [Phyllobacterium sp. 628]QND53250.1 hypothetical protein HB779_16120 [Phyllobacterium sp. 628]